MNARISMPRQHRAAWVCAAVVFVLVAGVVGWRVYQRPEGLQVGDRISGASVFDGHSVGSEEASVSVAFGSLAVTARVGHEMGGPDHQRHAPRGASLVEVDWTPQAGSAQPPVWPTASRRDRRDPGTDLTLVSGGRSYPLTTAVASADEGASVVVVVRGDGSDAHVESRIAGRAFTSGTGNVGPRTAESLAAEHGCVEHTKDDIQASVDCALPVQRSGYIPGLGVAPKGKEWLVVSGAMVTRRAHAIDVFHGGKVARYVPSGQPRVSVSVDAVSAKPRVAGKDERIGDDIRLADRAWIVDADKATKVTVDYRLPATIDRANSTWRAARTTYELHVAATTACPAVGQK